MVEYREKELLFVFPDSLEWEELDKRGRRRPNGMALVDLVIEREHDILLVEIKDPSHSGTPEFGREQYLERLRDNSLIANELVPKVRDSYTYMHLMERDAKPFKYIILLGLDAFSNDIQRVILSSFRDRLFFSLKNEAEIPWKRNYIADCIILTLDSWNSVFNDWPITRMDGRFS